MNMIRAQSLDGVQPRPDSKINPFLPGLKLLLSYNQVFVILNHNGSKIGVYTFIKLHFQIQDFFWLQYQIVYDERKNQLTIN